MAKVKSQVSTIGLLIRTLLKGEVDGWKNQGWNEVIKTTSELCHMIYLSGSKIGEIERIMFKVYSAEPRSNSFLLS